MLLVLLLYGEEVIGRPFWLLFDFEFFFPSEPHLLRQSHSQVQRGKGGWGGARKKIQLTERQKLGGKTEPENGQNTRRVTAYSRRNGNSLPLMKS